ncbi:MAG: FAD-dependent monooxygenase [Chloroflexi bacterium]|nr:FAD-dependent monooxygenase [Chloroflexota bacterium]
MRIAVVGAGTAGLASALLLARDGHDVTIVERVVDPRPVGAGILVQPIGQRILDELGLAEALARCSTPVRHLNGRTQAGRTVLRFGYADAGGTAAGLGVHRGDLFGLMWAAALSAGIEVMTGWPVDDVRHDPDGWRLIGPDGDEAGPWDLVIGADGSRSRLRHRLRLATHDTGYPYGAIWAVVPDPGGLAGDVLWQRYGDTRIALGILPTGTGQASIFWAEPSRSMEATVAAGPAAWLDRARPYVGHLGSLVEQVAETGILGVRYRDVVVPRPFVVRDGHAIVLVGDAAHAMSPQLGMGASLALADAWSLASSLRRHPADLADALVEHVALRRNHVRWYTWLSRIMTPVFQSDLVPMGWARDLVFSPAARVPWVRRQFATILRGEQTSPFTSWAPTRPGGALAGPGGATGSAGSKARTGRRRC